MFARFFMIIILCGLLVGCQPSAAAKPDSNHTAAQHTIAQVGPMKSDAERLLERFTAKGERVYQGAIAGETKQVRADVAEIENMLKQIPLGQLTSVEGIRALTNTIVETKRTINAVNPDPDRWLFVTAKMRLAMDALAHRADGLWTQYYKTFIEDLSRLEAAAKTSSQPEFASAFNEMQQHYGLIRPAVIIVHPAEIVEKFDSYMSFLQSATVTEPFVGKHASEAVTIGRTLMQELFMRQEDKPTFVPPIGAGQDPWIWVVGIGAVIVSVLTYVGYRKYQYEQMQARQRRLRNRSNNKE